MPQNLSHKDIVNEILEDDLENDTENEEIIHMLLQKTVSKNNYKDKLSFGGKIADKLAEIAGSWGFILTFCFLLLFWIILNACLLAKPYDPYPFILLNLVLSCVAAIQAPIIMMSQNRQEKKDRNRAENDYKVNLKSEIIIEDLHVKLDTILSNQEKITQRLDALENKKQDT